MSEPYNLYRDERFLRSRLKESILDFTVRPVMDLKTAVRDACFAECLLYVLDKLAALEGKTTEPEPERPKFQDTSFIVPYQGEELCRPEDINRAVSAGYEVVGTFQLPQGKTFFKLRRAA